MSGIIGADNRFAKDFNYPGTSTQGTIVAIYDVGLHDCLPRSIADGHRKKANFCHAA